MDISAVLAGEELGNEVENGRRGRNARDGGVWADINVGRGLEVDPSARQMVWRLEAGRKMMLVVRVAIVAGVGVFL